MRSLVLVFLLFSLNAQAEYFTCSFSKPGFSLDYDSIAQQVSIRFPGDDIENAIYFNNVQLHNSGPGSFVATMDEDFVMMRIVKKRETDLESNPSLYTYNVTFFFHPDPNLYPKKQMYLATNVGSHGSCKSSELKRGNSK